MSIYSIQVQVLTRNWLPILHCTNVHLLLWRNELECAHNINISSQNLYQGCVKSRMPPSHHAPDHLFYIWFLSEFLNNLKVVDALKEPGSRKRFDVAHVVLQVGLVLATLLKLNKIKLKHLSEKAIEFYDNKKIIFINWA